MEYIKDHEKLLPLVLGDDDVETDEDDEGDEDEDGSKEYIDRYDAMWEEEMRLPTGSSEVATFECEIENFTSWHTEKHFHVCPVPGEANTFVLLVLDWDDNYEKWEWYTCSAMRAVMDRAAVAGALLKKYAEDELPRSGGGEWQVFLEGLLSR